MAERKDRKGISIGGLENLKALQARGIDLSNPKEVEEALGNLPEGGIQKTSRSQKDPEAEPRNRETVRSRGQRTLPLPPLVVPSSATQEPKTKEEKVTQKQPTQTPTPNRVEPLYCPVCPDDQPKLRRKPTDIVCGDCYRQYINEAAIAFARGNFQNIFDWVVAKTPAILVSLEEQYASVKAEVAKLQEEVHGEVVNTLKRNAGGREIPREVWNKTYRNQRDNLWLTKSGNVKWSRMRALESRIALLKSILEKAKETKPATTTAETAAETASEVTTTEIVTPTTADAQTEPPATPTKPAKTPRKRTVKPASATK